MPLVPFDTKFQKISQNVTKFHKMSKDYIVSHRTYTQSNPPTIVEESSAWEVPARKKHKSAVGSIYGENAHQHPPKHGDTYDQGTFIWETNSQSWKLNY